MALNILVHVMACCLFGTKPLPKPMLIFLSIVSLQTNVSNILNQNIFPGKSIWKCHLQNIGHFVQASIFSGLKMLKWLIFCLVMLNIFQKNKNIFAISIVFNTNMVLEVKIIHSSSTDKMFIHQSQCHGYLCPGNTRSQGISSHGIELVLMQYSVINTRG